MMILSRRSLVFLVTVTAVEMVAQTPAQVRTDYSFFWQKTRERINFAESASGDLWNEVGHHGPALENEWVGYRIYFDKKAAVDVYSKPAPALELRKTGWYLPPELKGKGYGMDHYFVGDTIGFGSIRLWGEGEVRMLNPVTRRSAKVVSEGGMTYLDFLSEGIPIKGRTVDLLLRLTVYAGFRHATLETFVLSNEPVQLVTGINTNPALAVTRGQVALLTWGKHESLVADKRVEVGAAVIFDPAMVFQRVVRPREELVVTRPTKYLKTWLTSANAEEKEMNTREKFEAHVRALAADVLVARP